MSVISISDEVELVLLLDYVQVKKEFLTVNSKIPLTFKIFHFNQFISHFEKLIWGYILITDYHNK